MPETQKQSLTAVAATVCLPQLLLLQQQHDINCTRLLLEDQGCRAAFAARVRTLWGLGAILAHLPRYWPVPHSPTLS